ncbi:MAG: PadR family transcriptional regulator [Coriobacteriia bacterium]|nr:PadR family transcriptional regulator [Coriobacteriia bacterium]
MSVKYGLLAALDRRSMHGYELRRELEDALGAEWSVNYGQVYSTLERLVRAGLCVQSETVSVADAPDRKLYTVTPAGRAELRRWFLSPTDGCEAGRDELFAKVVLGLTGDVEVFDVIQAQRKGLLRRIGSLTGLKEELDAELDFTEVLQVDLSIAKTEAVIHWLDAAEARIGRAQASPVSGVAGGRVRVQASSAELAAAREEELT